MDLIVITKKLLWDMIQEQRQKDKFSVSGATFSRLYDLLRGKDFSQREYAQIWNWTRGKVRHNWSQIDSISSLLYRQSQQPSASPPSNHKNRSIEPETQPNNPPNNPPSAHIYKRTITNTKNLSNLTTSASSKAESTSTAENKTSIKYEDVRENWNIFAKANQLPLVRGLSTNRKTWIRIRYKKIWQELDEIYERISESDYCKGLVKDRPWKITFDFIWKNDNNYLKILEGNYSNEKFRSHSKDSGSRTAERPSRNGSSTAKNQESIGGSRNALINRSYETQGAKIHQLGEDIPDTSSLLERRANG